MFDGNGGRGESCLRRLGRRCKHQTRSRRPNGLEAAHAPHASLRETPATAAANCCHCGPVCHQIAERPPSAPLAPELPPRQLSKGYAEGRALGQCKCIGAWRCGPAQISFRTEHTECARQNLLAEVSWVLKAWGGWH